MSGVEDAIRDHAALSYIGMEAIRIRALELACGSSSALSSRNDVLDRAEAYRAFMAGEKSNG